MGNLEGWVQSGNARVWKMRAVLPSVSGVRPEFSCVLIMLMNFGYGAMLLPYELCTFFRDRFPDRRLPLPTLPYSLRSLRSVISFLFTSGRNGARPLRREIDCFGLSLRACGAAGARCKRR